jgi:hypothetical protein
MFKTAVQEKRSGIPWGVILDIAAFALLLSVGYALIT